MNFTISDLREQPRFVDAVADRIWQAWWAHKGTPLSYIRGRLNENLDASAIPFAWWPMMGRHFSARPR